MAPSSISTPRKDIADTLRSDFDLTPPDTDEADMDRIVWNLIYWNHNHDRDLTEEL